MPRKIVQLSAVKVEGYTGIYLYSVCDDGSAWRSVQNHDGSLVGNGWERIPPIPEEHRLGPGFPTKVMD